MKYSLLSLVAGTMACNARCPFCISKMTPRRGVTIQKPEIDWRNFHKAARLATASAVQTVMITGKGEPALFPEQVSEYLEALQPYNFPFVELQTNGILFQEKAEKYRPYLERWGDLGLTTIAISIVHHEAEANRSVYLPHRDRYIDLDALIQTLHSHGFTVRLACIMCNGMIDSPLALKGLVGYARKNGVEQLAIRPVNSPGEGSDLDMLKWVEANRLSAEQIESIRGFIEREGSWLYTFPHGGGLYDVDGQNLCLTNSLTRASADGEVRQLIFFPDGTLSFDWEHQGALLLRGKYSAQQTEISLRRVV